MKTWRPLFSLAICFIATQSTLAQDWPHFGGPNRNFHATTAVKIGAPFSNWSVDLGTGDAAPVVVGDRVFVNELTVDQNGREAIGIRCLSTNDGQVIWNTQVEERSYASQDISDSFPVRPIANLCHSTGRLVSISYGGILCCIDAVDGRLIWKHDMVSDYGATPLQYGFSSSPWCDHKKVVVACGGKQSLLKAFRLDDGSCIWSSEKGEAAYGSIAELPMTNGEKHLVYIGRDEMVGIDSTNGNYLWRVVLPKQGLTNAVTPMVIGPGLLLVAGQGFEGGRLYRAQSSRSGWTMEETRKLSRFTPFYCNTLFAENRQQVLTYNSGFLQGLAIESGKVLWKQRNWTDTNCAMAGDVLIGVRGDGYVLTANMLEDGPALVSGSRVINDRVWAPPVVIGSYALVRGRSSLVAFDWTKLPKIDALPNGTNVDAMTAMYGNRPERIVDLLKQAKTDANSLTFDDYLKVADDRSLKMSEKEYRGLIDALVAVNPNLSIRVTEDWMKRDPDSIPAFDQWMISLKAGGRETPQDRIENRFVEVNFDIAVPESTDASTNIYLAGNAAACGAWNADGVKLVRSADGHYRASIRLPKGRLEFKLTRGTWETVEALSDGRNISNRRFRITQPERIEVDVEAWKS